MKAGIQISSARKRPAVILNVVFVPAAIRGILGRIALRAYSFTTLSRTPRLRPLGVRVDFLLGPYRGTDLPRPRSCHLVAGLAIIDGQHWFWACRVGPRRQRIAGMSVIVAFATTTMNTIQ